jgi:hypothetical protein
MCNSVDIVLSSSECVRTHILTPVRAHAQEFGTLR